jgi:hypothetical protein
MRVFLVNFHCHIIYENFLHAIIYFLRHAHGLIAWPKPGKH